MSSFNRAARRYVSGALTALALVAAGLFPVHSASAATMPASIVDDGKEVRMKYMLANEFIVSPDGTKGYLRLGSMIPNNYSIMAVSLTDGQQLGRSDLPIGSAHNFAVSPDGSAVFAAAGATGHEIQMLNADANSLIGRFVLPPKTRLYYLAVSKDSSRLAAVGVDQAGQSRAFVFDIASKAQLASVPLPSGWSVERVWFGADPNKIYASSHTGDFMAPKDFSLQVIDVAAASIATQISVCAYIRSTVFVPNSDKAYVACADGRISVVSVSRNVVTKTLSPGFDMASAALAPDGKKLILGGAHSPTIAEVDVATDMTGPPMHVGESDLKVTFPNAGNRGWYMAYWPSGTILKSFTVSNDTPPLAVNRIFGVDRYETSAKASALYKYPYQAGEQSPRRVYITSGQDYPDALSAAPAASRDRAPLLFTRKNGLPTAVSEEITRLKPQQVVVIGGTGAVSAAVVAQLKKLAPTVTRIGGKDRYETSRAVITTLYPKTTGSFFMSTGLDYPDALSAAGVAKQTSMPLLLVRGTQPSLDAPTKALLSSRVQTPSGQQLHSVRIIGGKGVVSTGIENQLKAMHLDIYRAGGIDRFATNAATNRMITSAMGRHLFVSGYDFPDALVASSIKYYEGEPVHLVRQNCIPSQVKQLVTQNKQGSLVTLLGGPAVLSSNVALMKVC